VDPGLRLTSRERQIVVLAALGLHDKEIAWRTGLSKGTVRTHFRRAFQRNGLQGRVSLVVAWLGRVSSADAVPARETSSEQSHGHVFPFDDLNDPASETYEELTREPMAL
jgi:DNA-binding CsgD family transcriptional regulator